MLTNEDEQPTVTRIARQIFNSIICLSNNASPHPEFGFLSRRAGAVAYPAYIGIYTPDHVSRLGNIHIAHSPKIRQHKILKGGCLSRGMSGLEGYS
jgi:hypothetical protein